MLRTVLSILFVVFMAWNVNAEGMFKDMSAVLPSGTQQLNYGVAVTNVGDGQGPMEWVVAGFSGPNIVLQLDEATGKYNNIAQKGTPYEALRDEKGAAIGVCACDIDGDGLEEIYFLNTNDRYSGPKLVKDRLFKWRNGRYEDLFSDAINDGVSNMFAGRSVACVDRSGDGMYGILVATYAQDSQGKFGLIEMNEADPNNDVSSGSIALHNVAAEAGIDFSTGGRGITVGPILGDDGFSDVYFVNEGNNRLGNRGDNALFKNDGQGHFTNVASDLNLDDSEPGRGVALTDFNNDGKTDIVYGNWMGYHRIQIQGVDAAGNSIFTNAATREFEKASPIRTVIAADFDNSGILQVFMNNIVYRGSDASNRLYRIVPKGNTVSISSDDIGEALETYEYGTGAAVSDTDNDGILELLISHGESRQQPLSFYHVSAARASGNNWLRILPLTQYGAPARGAKVTVTLQDGTELSRISDGGSGYLCEMEPVAHFGLGQTTARRLTVTWPDGHTMSKTLTAADMNSMHKISFTGQITTQQGSRRQSGGQDTKVAYESRSRSLEGQVVSDRDTSSQDSRRRSQLPEHQYSSSTYASRERSKSMKSSAVSDYGRYSSPQTPSSTGRRYSQRRGQTYDQRYTRNYGQQNTGRESSQRYNTNYRHSWDRTGNNAQQGTNLQSNRGSQTPIMSNNRQRYRSSYGQRGFRDPGRSSRSSYWSRQRGSAYHSSNMASTTGNRRYYVTNPTSTNRNEGFTASRTRYPTYYDSRSSGDSTSTPQYTYYFYSSDPSRQNSGRSFDQTRRYQYKYYQSSKASNRQNARNSNPRYQSPSRAHQQYRTQERYQPARSPSQSYYQPYQRSQATNYRRSAQAETRSPQRQSTRSYQYSQTKGTARQRSNKQLTRAESASYQSAPSRHSNSRIFSTHDKDHSSTDDAAFTASVRQSMPASSHNQYRYSKYYKSTGTM